MTTICPHCKKTMMIPSNLRTPVKVSEGATHGERRHRHGEGDPQFSWWRDPNFSGKPLIVAAMLVAMVVVGGLLIGKVSLNDAGSTLRRKVIKDTEDELLAMRMGLEEFKVDVGRYPTTQEGLKALVLNPGITNWRRNYITMLKPDKWRHHYVYKFENDSITLFSCGRDGLPGTPDDIVPPPLPPPATNTPPVETNTPDTNAAAPAPPPAG